MSISVMTEGDLNHAGLEFTNLQRCSNKGSSQFIKPYKKEDKLGGKQYQN